MESLWHWLASPPPPGDVVNPFVMAYLCLFLTGFVAAAYIAGPGVRLFTTSEIRHKSTRNWACLGLAVFGLGLFLVTIRVLQIEPQWLGWPLWMVATIIALLSAGPRCFSWWKDRELTSFDRDGSTNSPG